MQVITHHICREFIQISFRECDYGSREVWVSIKHWRQWWLAVSFVNVWITKTFVVSSEIKMPDSYGFAIFDMAVPFPVVYSLYCLNAAFGPCLQGHQIKSKSKSV